MLKTTNPDYTLSGEGPYSILEDGGILYDLIPSKMEAEEILKRLKQGFGPEWEDIEPWLISGKGSN